MQLTIKADFKDVNRRLKELQKDVAEKATAMALNKTGAKAQTEMVRAITSEFNIKASEVRNKLRLIRAKRSGVYMQVELNPFASGKGRSMNLIRFMESKVSMAEARRRKKSGTQNVLRFKIKKQGGAIAIPGAFIGNDGRTVFKRDQSKYMKGRVNKSGHSKHAQAIEGLQTVGVPQMFNTKRINARVIARIRKELPIEFDRAIAQAIRRFNK